jgi:diguanylate cyclase (GGDEF)-like protein
VSEPGDSRVTRIRVRGEPQVEEGACLVVIYGPDLGRKVHLEALPLRIGRSERCDLVIPLDDVSREHCLLERDGLAFQVRDLGSTNGTHVNEVQLEPERPFTLRGGEHVCVGGMIFKFLDGGNVEALYHEEIYRMAIVDGLTRLHNRRYLIEFLERELARCRRHQSELALMLLDVDRFKQINDGHGHLAGDMVLREIADGVRARVRRESCFARFGGDEFAIVMPETGVEKARIFAERVRGLVEGLSLHWNGEPLLTSVSIGLAEVTDVNAPVDDFLRAADTNLYAAKQAGRNRVVG